MISLLLSTLLWSVAVIVALLVITLIIELLLSLRHTVPLLMAERLPVAVLMPAHNESAVLDDTLSKLSVQLSSNDRLLVVADNCTDDTAQLARAAGAEVFERTDAVHRGKGFALAAGMEYLANDPRPVVIIIDADCEVAEGGIAQLSAAVAAMNKPVQALYLMHPPRSGELPGLIATFAFIVRNRVRPRGGAVLGIPVHLMGTGMAFPWSILSKATLATGNIVEDMKLGVDLTLQQQGALFCEGARVMSRFPDDVEATDSQRTRWEHGHLQTIASEVPRLFSAAVRQLKPSLLLSTLDLAIPPLTLLLMLSAAVNAMALLLGVFGAGWAMFVIFTVLNVLFALSLFLVWKRFATDVLPASALLSVPAYMLNKFSIYTGFFRERQKEWVRTKRDEEP